MGAAFAEVLRGKFIAIQSYLKKQEKHWKDNLTLHLKQLKKNEKKKKKKPKLSMLLISTKHILSVLHALLHLFFNLNVFILIWD